MFELLFFSHSNPIVAKVLHFVYLFINTWRVLGTYLDALEFEQERHFLIFAVYLSN